MFNKSCKKEIVISLKPGSGNPVYSGFFLFKNGFFKVISSKITAPTDLK